MSFTLGLEKILKLAFHVFQKVVSNHLLIKIQSSCHVLNFELGRLKKQDRSVVILEQIKYIICSVTACYHKVFKISKTYVQQRPTNSEY